MAGESKGQLTTEEIIQTFRDLNLDTEEKREAILRFGRPSLENKAPIEQLFIRIVAVTKPNPEKQ